MACTGCGKVANIIDGYTNLLYKDIEVEGIAKDRLDICNSCTSIKVLSIMNNTMFKYCGICRCPISAKIRSIKEHCPINKW